MTDLKTEKEQERICSVANLLKQANKPIRILGAIAWNPQIKADFFAHQAQKLPEVEYSSFDDSPIIEIIREARKHIFPISSRVDMWLETQVNAIEVGARMLANVGKPSFFTFCRQAYGEPTTRLRYDDQTPLQLAESVRDRVARLNYLKIDKQIRIRRDARFTEQDGIQLINHEAFIHVLTSINGKKQTKLPILGEGHVGTTATQEGLAVFAEVISHSMELNRFQRLADRVFAIQMAIEGADFLQVYHYFLERTQGNEDQSFESARRVFRGGIITGGAPFTKDVVYLFGLLRVGGAINAIFSAGRSDCLNLLFCGKLDVMDLPALAELTSLGLCQLPQYLPPWIIDPRSLMAFLTYSTFMNNVDLIKHTEVAERLLADTPIITHLPK
ncbi:flavohemoglobin expression-modulating QEGLA motif protein [Cyanobacterium aponinum UTEX 3222]|uniref:flavohemoglobin expression-modulating QEGLA motif protein n=1 Tax=Cyanobacterium aponinum TaxID=379064 RepID=UPI002B4BE2C4|nr:flavohemoglobin expression-modulating QEGLA motif protein [Cyanobacterium aponinum]WRL37234.1 flavohemoglobin expression-modulating QEGLA motif protein [Cyanobacterium aponinum UTEX 3221]WRL43584.1 flavohemoglobin expression-modulating QEGLA motif protein [Cyanobacterium aponinum UTEX 3222]